jgi:Ca2+-dependent lipid-binding protein, contains C2 domain
MSKEGTLIVKPLTAKLTRNTETFGKMDPYCKVIIGQNFYQTAVHKDGGKNPGWNTTLTFKITNEDVIAVEVWDKDDLTKDDLVGTGSLSVSKVTSNKNKFSDWIPLTYKGKSAGSVLLDIEFIPADKNKTNTITTIPNQQTNFGGYNMGLGMNMQPNIQPIYQQQQQFIQQQPIYTPSTNMVYQQPVYTNPQQQFIPQQQFVQQQPMYTNQQVVYTNPMQQQQFVQPNIQYQQQQQYPQGGANIHINLG